MTDTLHAAMAEATRLTRAGRLDEAAALIRRTLRGGLAPAMSSKTSADSGQEPIDGTCRVIDDIPRLAPPPDSGRAAHGSRLNSGTSTPSSAFDATFRSLRTGLGSVMTEPSRAHPDIQAGGQYMTGTFTNPAGTRAYRLYIPSGYHGQALPLIVMLHGCSQNPDDFAAGTRMNVLAEREGFFVLYPEQTAQANPSRCWNWFKASDQHRDQGEPSILADMTRHIASTYAIDAGRVYVAGLSAGGAMALVMGVNYPEIYAAIGVHSGLPYGAAHDLPSAFAAMQQGETAALLQRESSFPAALKARRIVPTIVFHGDRDTTVHPGNGDRVLAQWAAVHSGTGRKLRVTTNRGQVPQGHPYTRSLYRDASGQIVMEQWLIHGAGHGWSGGSPTGAYTDPKGPSASEEMLRFFRTHSLDKP
jgi:poly(hydroxyalkanoate) depolymerase family esterase